MATACDSCGFKSNEVKAGGAVAPKGKRISLLMTEMEDLSRDILKVSCVTLFQLIYRVNLVAFQYLKLIWS